MRADKIPEIIRSLDNGELSYRCVMISGDWGIGKSYQVNVGIQNIKPVGYCSLFGIKSIDEVFGRLLFRLTLNKGKPDVNIEKILDSLNLGKLNPIKKILGSVFSPQMALDYILTRREENQKTTLLIFDDVERVSNDIDFDLLLGSVETLLHEHDNLKAVFIANLLQLSEAQRSIWDKYSEKVVDKVFPIEDFAEHIVLLKSSEENATAIGFMKQHGSKNLRTLQKADRFYRDVSQNIENIDSTILDDSYKKQTLCTVCYAIVFESIERIYEIEGERLSKEATDSENKTSAYLSTVIKVRYGTIQNRICYKYLSGITVTNSIKVLVDELVKYYFHGNDNFDIIISTLADVQEDVKPIFYCSDSEVQAFIVEQRKKLNDNNFKNLYHFLKCVDDILIWSKVQGIETSDLIDIVKEKVPALYQFEERQGADMPWSLNIYCEYLSSPELKETLSSLEAASQESYYLNIIRSFSEAVDAGDFNTAYELLYKIQRWMRAPVFLNTVGSETLFSALCNDLLLPTGSCTGRQYDCMQVAYSIAIAIDNDAYLGYLQNAMSKFSTDRMFLDRMAQIKKTCESAK